MVYSNRINTFLKIGIAITILFTNVCVIECFLEQEQVVNKKAVYLEGKIGSYAVFNCPLEFPQETPIPYLLHWHKDGRRAFSWFDGQLTTSDNYVGRIHLIESIFGSGRALINLTAIRESDAGWYECRVLFPNRTPSSRNNGTWFHMSIDGSSLIKIPPNNQTIMEGKTAFLNCVMKYPENSHVTWYKDGVPVHELQDISHRSFMAPDGSLSIDPTIMSDLGEYVCVVRTIEQEEQSAKAFLNIHYKAKVVYTPHEVYLPFGQPGILDCHFRSNPPLTNLRWEKDGFLFDPYNVQGVFYKRNGSLFFSSVDESHAGRYSCIPYNELGTDGPSPLIIVYVQHPPIFTVRPKTIYMEKLGGTVILECDASDGDGTRRALIQWRKKDGSQLPFSRVSFEGTNLTITRINETDRGIYQCSATNEAATIIADTELLIENVAPNPPYNLTANSSSNAITLRWVEGYIRPQLEYVVWYRLTDTTEWRTMKVLSRSKMETTILNLEPEQEYEFMVLSQDQYGDGMFSKAFRYYTKPRNFTDKPVEYHEPIHQFAQIGPPRNVSVRADDNGNGFIVSWLPPEQGMESLRLYVIRWYREPGHFLHGTGETREHFFKVKHLTEDEIYNFQVYSLSNGDYQAGSNEYEILVPPHRRMRAIAIGTTTAIIFLLTAATIFIYTKKRCFRPYKDSNENLNRQRYLSSTTKTTTTTTSTSTIAPPESPYTEEPTDIEEQIL